MTTYEQWQKKFDQYRTITKVLANRDSDHDVITALIDDNGKPYNVMFEHNGDGFARDLQRELQVVEQAEVLLSSEELEQANHYKKLKDGTNAFENWKAQYDSYLEAIKGIEAHRSIFKGIGSYKHGTVDEDFNKSFDTAIQVQLQKVKDKADLLSLEELREAIMYKLSKGDA